MTTPAEEDEFTELVDADFPRVDLVGKGANGVPRFLIAKGDAGTGLLDAEYVRSLIGKEASPVPDDAKETVTMTGSPAAIAKLIHGAPVRQAQTTGDAAVAKALAEYEAVVKAKYNAGDLQRMAASGAAMDDESYPIADEEDLRRAIRAVGRGGSSHNAIRKHVMRRAKSLGKSSMIPDNWAADGSLKEKVSKDMADMGPELDDGVDGMDPTVPLAAPDEEGPGDPTDPGSPAWEAIDAATAAKWTSIAVRLRNALCVMSEREMTEAALGDEDDYGAAFDLQDAMCAVDYVIDTLACFAAGEKAEAELGAEAMEAIGKALGGSVAGPLETFEGLAPVMKAGRVLSAANETEIRNAAASLQKVLTSLPSAPVAEEVTKEKEAAVPAPENADAAPVAKETASPDEQARDTGPVSAEGTTGLGEPRATGPEGALPGDGPQRSRPGDMPGRQVVKAALPSAIYDHRGQLAGIVDPAAIVRRVTKADGDGDKPAMQAVFDQNGDLIGIVDPSAITPVAGASKPPAETQDDGGQPEAAPAADGDLTPQPAAETGTPAEDVAKSEDSGETITITREVLKSIAADAAREALEAQGASHQEVVAKMAADKDALAGELDVLKGRLETVEAHPAAPKVFTSGAVPPAHQMRGQDQGARQVDVTKARERKAELYAAGAPDQARIAKEMQQDAIAHLEALHATR